MNNFYNEQVFGNRQKQIAREAYVSKIEYKREQDDLRETRWARDKRHEENFELSQWETDGGSHQEF